MRVSRLLPSRLRSGAEIPRLRDYRNVFIAQSVSVFGDGITPVALTFAVLDLTGSGTDLGIVLAAQSLPLTAPALVGGLWADWLPRAALMLTSDLVRAAVQTIAAALLLTGTAQIWLWVMLLRASLVLCIVIAPLRVLGPLGLREQGYGAAAWGWLQAVFSAGMIVGAFIALRYRPRRPMVTVCLTGSTAVAAPLALPAFGDPWVLGGIYGLRGVAVGILVAVWNTTLQTQIPKASLGRVTAWDWMASLALWPAGLAVAGPLAQAFGVTTRAGVTGIAGLAAAFWVLLVKDVWRLRLRSGASA